MYHSKDQTVWWVTKFMIQSLHKLGLDEQRVLDDYVWIPASRAADRLSKYE